MNARLVIVQPYVPTYRVAFFEGLRESLANQNIDCIVAAGLPQGDQAGRGDAVVPDWLKPVRHISLSFRGRSIDLGINPKPWARADAVILGLEGSSVPVYQALANRMAGQAKVGLWGHVRPYVNAGHAVDLSLERWQMKRADRVFAYTPGGSKYATDRGISPEKVTTVMNTVDTSELSSELNKIGRRDVEQFAALHDFDPDRAISFIGGLDKSKRIDFLAQALDELWVMDPSVKLLVGGRGPDEALLKNAAARKQVVLLGYLKNYEKALVLKSARAICMPGRIGLVAVDALVAQRPIITTTWKFHAPEAEYLVEGESLFTSTNMPKEFAQMLLYVIQSKRHNISAKYPTLQAMIQNFATGAKQLVESE